MTHHLPLGVRVGGSALPDGVMMLTPLAVAIARQKPGGGFHVESFALPERKPLPLEKLPFIRILPKLVGQMSLVLKGWKPGQGKRIPFKLVVAVVLVGILSAGLNYVFANLPSMWHAIGSSLLQLSLFFALILVTRAIPQFGRIWRFHGGEHQAIAAYEAGMELTPANAQTRTLYHPRCGTNLATLAMLLMLPGMVVGSVISGIPGYLFTLAVPLMAICIAFEMVMLGQSRARIMLWPGLTFQRLTVVRPGAIESEAGIVALTAALAEHGKIEALRSGAAEARAAAGVQRASA